MPEEQQTNWFQEDRIVPEPEVTDTPATSSVEEKTEEKADPATEGATDEAKVADQPEENLPFHKHPRFKALTQENRELKQRFEELSGKIDQIGQKTPETVKKDEDIPEWFQQAFGYVPEVWNNYKAFNAAERSNIKAEVIQEIQSAKNQAEEQEKTINQFIETEITTLKDEGNNFDRNELMKTVLDNKLFDDQGRLNFRAGLALLRSKPADSKTAVKKAVAAKTDTGRGEAESKDYVTSSDLRGKSSWRDLK